MSPEYPEVALSPDGTTLAVARNGNLKFWSTATGKLIGHPIPLRKAAAGNSYPLYYNSIFFSQDGKTLAIADASTNGSIELWNVPAEKLITILSHTGTTSFATALSYDGRILATLDFDGTVQLWNVATGKQITASLPGAGRVTNMAFSPDSDLLATADSEGTIRLWDASTGGEIGAPMGSGGGDETITSMAFTSDDTTLLAGNANGTVQLWDVAITPRLTIRTGDFDGFENWAAFTSETTLITYTQTAQRWNTNTGRQIGKPFANVGPSPFTEIFEPAAVSPNGKILATVSAHGDIQAWNIDTGQQIGEPALATKGALLTPVAFSPDGNTLLVMNLGPTGGQSLWNPAAGTRRHTANGAIGFTPSGEILTVSPPAANALTSLVRAWSAVTGKPVSRPFTIPTQPGLEVLSLDPPAKSPRMAAFK